MKQSKEELIKELAVLSKYQIESIDKDTEIRRNISKFLNSWEVNNQWRDTPAVKVLSWAEIYFELGKSQGYTSVLRDDRSLRGQVENLQQNVEMLLKEAREKKS